MAACIGTAANFMHDPMYYNVYHLRYWLKKQKHIMKPLMP